ncbi:MAG: ribonuclease HII [Christensenellaceae bacterium]|jgi:ribonuclease HII
MDESNFYYFETLHAAEGIRVAGADEAGRGPLAGPVVAAAVILPTDGFISGIQDSKKLTEKKRERLYDEIIDIAIAYGIGVATVEEIEAHNILNATRMAFAWAIERLPAPYILYTDYITGLPEEISYTPIIKGDAKVYSIAAASILAKVTRDRMMLEYDALYPTYGFAKHKGYGTKAHRESLLAHGPLPIHRKSFLRKILG